MGYGRGSKAFIIFSLVFFLIAAGVSTNIAGSGESYMLVYVDDFNDYVVKEYEGSDGPAIWYQEVDFYAAGKYEIVSSGGKTFYKLTQSGSFGIVKSILYYYVPFPFLGPLYFGPNNYTFSASMKLENTGGLVFRAQLVKVDDQYKWGKYYLAAVNKITKTIWLYYVQVEPYMFVDIASADIPGDVDLDDWISISITARGEHIEVNLEGKTLIDASDDRLLYGTVGLFSWVGSTSFDSVIWRAILPKETTVTSEVTVTSTTTITSATTITTTSTIPGTGATATITKTETVTKTAASPGSTATKTLVKTLTVTKPGKTKTVYSAVTRTLKSYATTTVTTFSRYVVTRTVTKTFESVKTQEGWPRCLIATAAFGSELAPQVQALRRFRDGFVMKTFAGENFMKAFNTFYYSWSPYIARAEYENPALRSFVRVSIYPLIYSLELSHIAARPFSATPELAVLISGLIASFLIGLIYVSPILAAAALLWKWWRGRFPFLRLRSIISALLLSLTLFAVAEAFSSTVLMIAASALTVISCIAIGATLSPILIEYILDRRKT